MTAQNPPGIRPISTKEAQPYLWIEKPSVRRIREAFEHTTFLDQALAVYLALCELASDRESPTFTESKRNISARSGVKERRAAEILNRFKAIGLLSWTQNTISGTKELGPNTYSLLGGKKGEKPPPRTQCTTYGKNRKRENCRDIEEQEKNSLKNPLEGSLPKERQSLGVTIIAP
jgi:hypothetical protein